MATILVVDDNTDIRENTAEILELAGYKTLVAENGKIGVEIAFREKPDVIICDIMMPVLDGYGVLHLLGKNEQTRNIPFIFLSAKTERADLRKGMEMGADDYITKPFEEVELLNAIEVRLKKKQILDKEYGEGVASVKKFMNELGSSGMIKNFASQYDVVTYHKKQILFQKGKRPRSLFIILSGKVKCLRSHEDGKEYITQLSSAEDFVGLIPIVEESAYEDTAIVLEDSEILAIPKEDFLQMLYADPAVTSKFIKIIANNVREKEDRLLTLAYSSLRKRVATALVNIHEKFNSSQQEKHLNISREDIARYVGTATESLIRTLSDFKSEKLINIVEGKISIANPQKLRTLLY
ncbi:MAG TPA: response regulator [Chryseolinea sp.]|nr:response regulator [Chryseolinea sp.]